MNSETRKALESEVMRLVPRAIYSMKNTYKNDKGYLMLQDFFTAIPFTVKVELLDEATYTELEKSDAYPSVFKYIGGYTKLVKNDDDIKYLKVYIIINAPDNLKSPSEAIQWVNDNIILNSDFNGGDALLFVYMHEVSHIMHKHLFPSINAKFDAIINSNWKDKSNAIPDGLKHKIKNFAEDFFINSLLMENANTHSKLGDLCQNIKSGNEEIAFLYNPELSFKNDHTVETIIVELLKNMEAKSIDGDGQPQDGDGNGQPQDGDGNGQPQDGDGNGQPQISGTRYKIKYGDFEYEFWDLHGESNCQNGQNKSNKDTLEAENAARNAANQVINKMKGSGSAEIASALGFPIEVTVDWLEVLTSNLFKEVRHKTNKVSTTWKRLKNKYRHIAHLPATVNYENVLNAIVVIDQSGSMSDLELRKINYIIKKLVKRVKTLRVIIHDSAVVYNKEFKRVVERDLENQLFKKRMAQGGTSHKDVFVIIEEQYNKRISEEFITLIFSDMYSDIETLWNKYKWTDVINTYLVCTDTEGAHYVKNIPATKILMDTGEKL